jgi:hypothetical protein
MHPGAARELAADDYGMSALENKEYCPSVHLVLPSPFALYRQPSTVFKCCRLASQTGVGGIPN